MNYFFAQKSLLFGLVYRKPKVQREQSMVKIWVTPCLLCCLSHEDIFIFKNIIKLLHLYTSISCIKYKRLTSTQM